MPTTELDDEALERYAQHVIIDRIGMAGQVRLLESSVLVVGAGGLGSPVLLYLAASGIGTLGLLDHDVVTLGNLQRQIIYSNADIGKDKIQSVIKKIKALRPDIDIRAKKIELDAYNVADWVSRYDVIVDASDNFKTRCLLNQACFEHGKIMVSAALSRFEGQLTCWKPGQFSDVTGKPFPCYRCIFPEDVVPEHLARCDRVGILGPVAGIMGSLQASEVIKEILKLGESLAGFLFLFDSLYFSWHKIAISQNSECTTCQRQKITHTL